MSVDRNLTGDADPESGRYWNLSALHVTAGPRKAKHAGAQKGGGRWMDRARRVGGGHKPPRRADNVAAEKRILSRSVASVRPELPPDVDLSALTPDVRAELQTLPRGVAELVGDHLVAAWQAMDDDPQRALAHARFARRRAGRLAVVRETVGVAAYRAGEWSEALAELRAARRLGGGVAFLPLLADCERALGRPERALEIARSAEASQLGRAETVELRIVAAGARRDLGQFEAALLELQGPELESEGEQQWQARLRYAYADSLLATGRIREAIRWFVAAAEADVEGATDAAERAIELGEHPQPPP